MENCKFQRLIGKANLTYKIFTLREEGYESAKQGTEDEGYQCRSHHHYRS